jgi:hypothetical protein
MGLQYSDAPSFLQGHFLGDPNVGRLWFDATYKAWGAFGFLTPLLAVLLWTTIPLGLLVALGVFAASRWASPRLPESTYRLRGRARPLYPDLVVACGTLLALLSIPPVRLLFPLPWYGALAAAPLLAVLAIRATTRYVDHNRPLAYWRKTLQREAAGPRPRRASESSPTVAPLAAETGLHDLHLLALSVKDVTVPTYISKATVEALRWEPDDPERAGQMIGWLASHGVGTEVDRDNWLILYPGEAAYLQVKPRRFVVYHQDGSAEVLTSGVFAERYQEV